MSRSSALLHRLLDWRRRRSGGRRTRQYHHTRADLHAAVEILDVVVGQADAAGRHVLADRRGLIGAVDAVERLAGVEGARAKRIAFAARPETAPGGPALGPF